MMRGKMKRRILLVIFPLPSSYSPYRADEDEVGIATRPDAD